MRPRPAPLEAPTSRRYVPIEFSDFDAAATQVARAELAARVAALDLELRSLPPSEAARAPELLRAFMDLQIQGVALQLRKRTIWFRRSVAPEAMACYSWVWEQLRQLTARLRSEGRELFTFEEWHHARIVPAAALVGVCWYDLGHELETPASSLGDGGYDFERYGAAVLEELLDSEHGLTPDVLGQISNDLLNQVAGAYVGVSQLQERSDFLEVRRGLPSAPPSASA